MINPFFGTGGYPLLMREMVDAKSILEGRIISKLPRFTPLQLLSVKGKMLALSTMDDLLAMIQEDFLFLSGSADFLSFNQFTALFTSFLNLCPTYLMRQNFPDSGVFACQKSIYNKTQRGYQEVLSLIHI